MQQRRRTLVFALAAVAALALSGCSALSFLPGMDKGASSLDAEESPLSKYQMQLWDDKGFSQEEFDKENLKREELVAECMAEEGFEYVPVTSTGGMVFSSDDTEGIEWGSLEFAEKYGYGIVDYPGKSEQETPSDSPEEFNDPNQEIVSKLKPSELDAYYKTLHGEQPEPEEGEDGEMVSGEWNWETSGCYGWAEHELGSAKKTGYEAASNDPEYADLMQQMNDVYLEMYDYREGSMTIKNEELAALAKEWAECMAGSGYTEYSNPQDVNQKLNTEFYEKYYNQENSTGPSKEQEKEFQAREIKTAVADFKCKDKIDFDDESLKIQFELEQKFVDEHKAELDAMVAKYGVGSDKKK